MWWGRCGILIYMKNKTGLIITVGVIVVLALFIAQRLITPGAGAYWEGTDIACLTRGHQNLAQHFHPTLTIIVDDEAEVVPGNVGIRGNCMAEAHTHDTSGTIHFESVAAGKTFTVADFFAVWGRSIERDGYTVLPTLNGESLTIEELQERPLRDHDAIVLTYTSILVPTQP
jgi:hypothetical protein